MNKAPLTFNSRDENYKSPFGAVREGAAVRLRLGILDGFYVSNPRAVVRLEDGEPTRLLMRATGIVLDGYYLVECEFSPDSAGHLWFHFEAENGVGDTMRVCDTALCEGGEGRILYNTGATPYLLTVYQKTYDTPAWFRGCVMYQIFPDRFYRSAKKRYPDKARMHARWDEDVFIAPAPGQDHYAADDFFGGNLAGIAEKLDYLQSLGVGALYLNPIFMASSNHRYNTADYEKIDPLLGGADDFRALCRAAKARHIGVILDGVFSHTGSVSRYFNADGTFPETGAAQSKDSKYFSWYRFTRWPDAYACWWGDRSLPEVDETEASYRAYMLGENGIVRRWIRAGASGFRLDVADELPDLFLDELFAAVRAENPEAVVIGEVWENAAVKTAYGKLRRYMQGGELDSVMNYPLRFALTDFLLGAPSSVVARRVMQQMEQYPPGIFEALMNMTGTHDVPRILSILSGMNASENIPREALAALEPDGAQRARGTRLFALYLAAIMTLPGNPCVYYGDEAGLTGMRDPFCRRTFPWGREDKDLLETVRTLAALRKKSAALSSGTLRFIEAGDGTLVYERRAEGAHVVVAVSRDGCALKLPAARGCVSLADGARYAAQNNVCSIELPALSFAILREI